MLIAQINLLQEQDSATLQRLTFTFDILYSLTTAQLHNC